MDAALFAALKAGEKVAHLIRVTLPAYTIRWTLKGGFVRWGSETFAVRDETYGVIDSIGEIIDGVVGSDASPTQMTVIPPTLASLADFGSADAQGAKVEIYLAAVSNTTGQLIGEPYRIHIGYLDAPSYLVRRRRLVYDILTAEAIALEPNDEQRQSDSFHQDIWPGERHYEYQTEGTKKVFWRDDDPNNAIGFISPRPKKGGDPFEFNYETDAAWPFPFGRVAIPSTVNYRVGYGPTNRYNSLFCTLAASGPINAFISYAANDEITTFDGTLNKAQDGDHEGFMWLQRKVGTQPQTALTTPTGTGAGDPPPSWTSAHKASGKAVVCWTGFENSKKDEFRGGVPAMLHIIEGLKGHDPLDSGSDADDPTTWPYIDDGPTTALNWAMGRWEGASTGGGYGRPWLSKIVGGYGAPLEAIDVQRHADAADIVRGYGWKVSDVPTSAEDKHTVRKRLLEAGGCEPARICGQISLVCYAAPIDSLMDVTNDDTAGDFPISMRASRLERRNVGLPKFKSEAHRWEMTQIRAIGDPDWIVEDKGRKASGPSYPSVPDKDQCAALMYLELAHARALQGEAPMRPHMMAVEPGQGFTWQEPLFLLVGVKVQVRRRAYDPMKAVVKIRFRAERDANYTEALAQVGITPPPSDDYVGPPSETMNAPSLPSATLQSDNVTVLVGIRAPSDLAFDHINVRRSVNSTTMPGINLTTLYGAPGQVFTFNDTPGSGVIRYWFQAADDDDSLASSWVMTGTNVP